MSFVGKLVEPYCKNVSFFLWKTGQVVVILFNSKMRFLGK